ncbi:MAG: outer membrane protein assembly factor BamD [Planctomycetes bacterium]|nr:outer membrane protein assembly factor BamD [Planctomycetota bacterium]
MLPSPFHRRAVPWLPALLAACAGAPAPVPEPERVLAECEARLAAGDAATCRDRLLDLTDLAFPRRLRDRFDLALCRAHAALGDTWDAFEVAERFADRHPHSDLRGEVGELLWQLGGTMAQSGRGFLFFWSDRRAGRTVLEHLITRHPDSPRLADALRLLGDLAFDDEEYGLAQERFRDLMRKRPDSEWVPYARFRFAMAIVAGLKGPDYDLDRMQHATRELRAFLDGGPENPEFVRTATEELGRLHGWQAERHLGIAGFYHRVGNESGRRYHLALAAGGVLGTTAAGARAAAELAALAAPAPPQETPR